MDLRYLRNKKVQIFPADTHAFAWDLFLSAFNSSQRVKDAFAKIFARRKIWLILPEYGYTAGEFPDDAEVIKCDASNEADLIVSLFSELGIDNLKAQRICIDITGFMRPQILFLVYYLRRIGVHRFHMIYSEPAQYGRRESTKFSHDVEIVRQVSGFEGNHIDDVSHDILVVGVGYDDELVSRIVNDKDGARVIQLLGLPSLSADMYQESVLRLDKTSLPTGPILEDRVIFAPANDPFVVATELSEKLAQLRAKGQLGNIYLSPLATKPQALGFGLFYLQELWDQPASVLFPFSRRYERETSNGVGRVWSYEICFS